MRLSSPPVLRVFAPSLLVLAILVLGLPQLPFGGSGGIGPHHPIGMLTRGTRALPAVQGSPKPVAVVPPGAVFEGTSSAWTHSDLRLLGLQSAGLASEHLAASSREPAPGPAVLGPGAASTASNFYVNGSECGFDERATQLGSSPDSLATLVYSTFGLYNGSAAGHPCIPSGVSVSPFFYSHGALEVARSTDSGRSWTDSWPNSNGTWYGTGVLNNSVYDGLGGIASDQGTSVDTSTVLVAGSYSGSCLVLVELIGGSLPSGCTGDVLNSTTTGAAVDRSSDGARSWYNSTVLSQVPAFTYEGTRCGGGFLLSNITGEPSVALNPVNHHAVAVWDDYQQGLNATCNLTKLDVSAYRSVSTDGGRNWSPPALIAARSLTSRPSVSIGPAPTYPISIVMNDDTNGTLATRLHQADHSLLYTRSSDNGTSWTAPSDIQPHGVGNISGGVSNTNLQFPQYPTIASDNWSGSPYRGNVYVAFGNNETGGINFGYPGISIVVRTAGGTAWSSPIVISDPSRSRTLWDPAIAVSSDGTVWVTFVAVGVYSGYYQEYGVDSRDGGGNWSSLFPVADSSSVPGYVQGVSVSNLLYNFGLVGTSNGTYAGWTDCRVTNCTSTFDVRAYMAQLFAVRLTSDAPSATLQVTTYGILENLTISSGTIVEEGWASGSSHTVVAPISVASNVSGSIEAFQGFSGLYSSNNSSITFITTGGGTLHAAYRTALPAFITGTIQPNLPYVQLTITASGGVPYPIPLTSRDAATLEFNDTVPAGTYSLSVTAGFRYLPVTLPAVHVAAGNTVEVQVLLMKSSGSLAGSVTLPGGARLSDTTVTVNGTALALNASGGFSTTLPWGYYWVNATNPATVPYAPRDPVVVSPGSVSSVPIQLGGGWLEGLLEVSPGPIANLTVTVNGSTAGVRIVGGTYNWSGTSGGSAPGGWYWINASQPGYNTSRQYVHLRPGVSTILNLHLSDSAFILGEVRPLAVLQNIRNDSLSIRFANQSAGAVFYASGYNVSSGSFNLTVRGGLDYRVTASARGYQPLNLTVAAVNAGEVSPVLVLTFVPLPTNCSASGSCAPPSGFPGYPWSILGAAAGIAAVLGAAVYLMRRRPAPTSNSPEVPEEEAPVYGARPLHELPKLTREASPPPEGPEGRDPPPTPP